jgi:uncharacterized protein YjdB
VRRPTARAALAAALAAVLAAGCTGPAGTLRLAPDSLVLTAVGETAVVQASSGGAPVAAADLVWSTSEPSVAIVAPDGTVRAIGSGATTLRASRPGASATAAVVVDATIAYRPCMLVQQVGEVGCGQLSLTVTRP